MLRSIKSGQRKMRVIALKLDSAGELVDFLDKRQVTKVGNVITFNIPFAQEPMVILNDTAAATVSNKGSASFELAVTADVEVLIIGSDTAEKY